MRAPLCVRLFYLLLLSLLPACSWASPQEELRQNQALAAPLIQAIEQFSEESRHFPDHLDALVPTYLYAIPRTHTGERFHYDPWGAYGSWTLVFRSGQAHCTYIADWRFWDCAPDAATHHLDEKGLLFLNQEMSHPLLDALMVALTLGGFALLPGVGATLCLGRARRVGVAVLGAFMASLALALLFQYLSLRPRPTEVRLLLATPPFPAFPSGHAATAFATATVLALAYRRPPWGALALALAAGIALSRVYLGAHYPSDILAGALLGAGVGAACYGLLVAEPGSPTRWRWLLWPQVALVLVITEMAYLDLVPVRLLRWPMADKVMHFLLFGAVVFWLNLWLNQRGVSVGRYTLPLAVLLPFTVATAEEAMQALSPVRSAGLDDLAFDLAGMLFFWWVSRRVTVDTKSRTHHQSIVRLRAEDGTQR